MARNYRRDLKGRFSRTAGGGVKDKARSRRLSAENRKKSKLTALQKAKRNNQRVRAGIAIGGAALAVGLVVAGSKVDKAAAQPLTKPNMTIKMPDRTKMNAMIRDFNKVARDISKDGGMKTTPSGKANNYGRTTIGPLGGKTRPLDAGRKAMKTGRSMYAAQQAGTVVKRRASDRTTIGPRGGRARPSAASAKALKLGRTMYYSGQ